MVDDIYFILVLDHIISSDYFLRANKTALTEESLYWEDVIK